MSGSAHLTVPPSPIRLDEDTRTAVYRHALAAFPNECCGWITADGARPCTNAQPTAPAAGGIAGRTAETAYVIAGEDLLAFGRAFDTPSPPLAIYHSHPNGRAYFSATDRAVALGPWGDEPAYPVAHVVIGTTAARVVEVAIFQWSETAQDFLETDRWQVT